MLARGAAPGDDVAMAVLRIHHHEAGSAPVADVEWDGERVTVPFRPTLDRFDLDNVAFVLTHPDLASFNPLRFFIVRAGQIHKGWFQQVD